MKIRTLLPAVLALATTAAFAADATFDKTLTVSGSPQVSVNTHTGYIHLNPGSDSQIHVIGHVHPNKGWSMSSSSDIDARIQKIASNPPITQSGSQVTIGDRDNNDLYRDIAVDLDITLPRTSAIVASSGSGGIDIQGVGSTLKAQTGSGAVHARGIQGPANLQTGSGTIELDEAGPGDVRAQTGSGSIRLNGISGGLQAQTGSGEIEAAGKPTSEWNLHTGSGGIHLTVGKSTAFNLNASSGSGGIHVDQPINLQGDLNQHHVTAAVNGGGPTIMARTGSGNIRIE
jgi:Putative adhesin